jgi:hypothetical protein
MYNMVEWLLNHKHTCKEDGEPYHLSCYIKITTKMEISCKTHETDRWLKSSYVKGAVAGLGSMTFVYIIMQVTYR